MFSKFVHPWLQENIVGGAQDTKRLQEIKECAKLSSCREISRTSLAILQRQDAWKNSPTDMERFQNDSNMTKATADHNAHSFPIQNEMLINIKKHNTNSPQHTWQST